MRTFLFQGAYSILRWTSHINLPGCTFLGNMFSTFFPTTFFPTTSKVWFVFWYRGTFDIFLFHSVSWNLETLVEVEVYVWGMPRENSQNESFSMEWIFLDHFAGNTFVNTPSCNHVLALQNKSFSQKASLYFKRSFSVGSVWSSQNKPVFSP